jgi:hypothetical protein
LHVYENVLNNEVAFEKRIQDAYVYVEKLEIVCVIERKRRIKEILNFKQGVYLRSVE